MNAGYSSGWCEQSFGLRLVAREILPPQGDPTAASSWRRPRASRRRQREYLARLAARRRQDAVNYAVYQSIVSKIGTVIPLFGKALVDIALKRHGFTVESISPVEMLELIKTEINPRLADRMKSVSTVLNAGAGLAQADDDERIVQANSVARRMAGARAFELPSAELFQPAWRRAGSSGPRARSTRSRSARCAPRARQELQRQPVPGLGRGRTTSAA